MQITSDVRILYDSDIPVLGFIYSSYCALRDSIFVFSRATFMVNKFCDETTDSKELVQVRQTTSIIVSIEEEINIGL